MFFLAGIVFSDSLVWLVNVLAGQAREDKRSASVLHEIKNAYRQTILIYRWYLDSVAYAEPFDSVSRNNMNLSPAYQK